MSKIVGIGACVMDTLVSVPNYPTEDTKLRATAVKMAGGGPTATGLVAAQKLGELTQYIGVLSDDTGGVFLKQDFEKYDVDTSCIEVKRGFRSFTSNIWLSQASASRTCVFDKGNLPPLDLNDKQIEAIAQAKLLMVDGNELSAAVEGAKVAKAHDTKVLYDCGGLYEGVGALLELTDIMIPSEEFALKYTGKESAEEAAVCLYEQYKPEIVVITQGERGGLSYDGKDIKYYPCFPTEVVDSNGSGDVFHGAFAAAIAKGFNYDTCCIFSSAVSSLKCRGVGARESVPDYDAVIRFLKEKGYDL